jgi:3-deoxy-D-manno-octulosonate cytidylyltransferase
MSLRSRVEDYLNSLWYSGHRRPPVLLRGLERVHRGLARSRHRRPAHRPPVPVIVVGNLCAGGSGKTPTVIALSKAFKADLRVAVISRGYGGGAPAYPLLVEAESPAEDSGDEALLIRRAAGVPVIVDPDRARALHHAIEICRPQVVISDDGLQHQDLPRSFEICLFDGGRGVGNGRLLPAGPLRQPLSRLDDVDQVLIKGQGMRWPGAARFELEPVGFRALGGALNADLDAWRGRSATAFCALANPGQFGATLERAQASAARSVHVATDDAQIAAAVDQAGGDWVMTSADHLSGTDRLVEAVDALDLDDEAIVVNLQGDEPGMPVACIEQVAGLLQRQPLARMATLWARLSDEAQWRDPNVVKLLSGHDDRALYFSRAAVPFVRSGPWPQSEARRHVGLYAYRVDALRAWPQLRPSPLESLESLEQLRALQAGWWIATAEACESIPVGIDTLEDLERFRREASWT